MSTSQADPRAEFDELITTQVKDNLVKNLVELSDMVDNNEISGSNAKIVFRHLISEPRTAAYIKGEEYFKKYLDNLYRLVGGLWEGICALPDSTESSR